MSQAALKFSGSHPTPSPPPSRSGALVGYLKFLLLAGADKYAHTGSTLLDHLTGVHELLADWGAAPSICEAGLFHSVYGTGEHTPRLVSSRSEVRTLIGMEAEQLAFCFAHLDRQSFLEGIINKRPLTPIIKSKNRLRPVAPEGWRALSELFAANAIEQAPRRNAVYRQQQLLTLQMLRDCLSAGAQDAVQRLHEQVASES